MVYRLDAGTVIDADGNLVIENMYASSVTQQYKFQGSTSGYVSGGFINPPASASNVIDKFPFSSDTNASDVGDLLSVSYSGTGVGSTSNGYNAGGRTWSPFSVLNVIQKYPFSSDANATDVGDLTRTKFAGASGQSMETHGYMSGGIDPSGPSTLNEIEKFSFSSDGNATDVGDLTQQRYNPAGQSSETHGYTSGGSSPSTVNTIDKFPFSTDANASDVGDLTVARYGRAGGSSTTHGYTMGGFSNVIDRFPFASDANATDVGDTDGSTNDTQGHSSTTDGYISSMPPFAPAGADISKFPFATATTNTSSVGDLSVYRTASAGTQV